ncbi:hypothetical protein LK996_14545 [Lysobacter sp. A6]|uniref:EF-hand domain-containing protein n=1 Tax=Noviluteimonas lactosilytica TaxID=2888523 RepID=A0ABS8JKZ7_9GAMM|nr:hypothetical protein [Lysobacter lactosilyticus]MCC8364291.1 hypothetical protein [Lysobacter lactosilyticus]
MTRKTLCTLIAAMLATAAFSAAANKSGDDKFKMMDTNSDGQVSSAEHAAGVTKMFGEMDANKDGFVTAAEMDARHAMKADKGDMRGHDMKSSDKIAKMDKDGDGKLSAAEHDAGAADMFKMADSDGNGMLSQSEMSSAHGKMMSKDKASKDKDKDAAGMTDHSGHDAGSGTTTPPPDGNDG